MSASISQTRVRIRRHVLLALAVVVACAVLMPLLHGDLRERVSTSTAYVALALLAITLSFGPWNVLRRHPIPVSFNRRRDFGIWSAIVGVGHSAVGLTVHMRGRMQLYFFPEPGHASIAGFRADPFGAANDIGLIAALLLVLLALISNDVSLRTLGTVRWRTAQRSAYIVLALTIVHAVLYQVVGRQRGFLVATLVITSIIVLTAQALGVRQFRLQRRAGPTDHGPGQRQ